MFGTEVVRLLSHTESHLEDSYMTWAKTEYKNDWVYHYNRLKHNTQPERKKLWKLLTSKKK